VYGGRGIKIGAEFEYHHLPGARSVIDGPRPLKSMPKQGEKAIWMVTSNAAGKLAPLVGGRWGISFPSRMGIDKQYADVENLAALQEEWQSVPAKDRLDFLKEKASSKSALLGHWAITTMSVDKPELYRSALDHFINRKDLTVGAQVALDQELVAAQGDLWQQSDSRFRVVQSWMAADLTSYELSIVKQHLSRMLGAPGKLGFSDERQAKMREALLDLANRTPN
jgi:hypothetical protein